MAVTTDDFPRLLAEAAVPGMAAAIIRDGHVARTFCAGVRSASADVPVDERTVFAAASLSKPVFAYAVLKLVDRRVLSLDAPLGDYLPAYIAGDPRAASITARAVLSHSGGLPNWRNAERPLRTYFAPGERFSYSGEGFLYLQKAVEKLTGERTDVLVRREVFAPLGMTRSSFVWQERFDDNRAEPHDAFGLPALSGKPAEANVAGTLQTTAADFARFLVAVLDGSGLKPQTAQLWLEPHIEVRHRGPQALTSFEDVATDVAWGLGWGLEPKAGTFFHWGDNGAFKAFTVGSTQQRAAAVVLTNGESGLSIMSEMMGALMPGKRASLVWLDYVRHDAPVRRLFRMALARGAEAVWPEIENATLEPSEVIWIAQGLDARGRETDAVWLRARVK